MAGRVRQLLSTVFSPRKRQAPRTTRRPPTGAIPPPAGLRVGDDFTGRAQLMYAPDPDGDADPGEVVWTWVPYEEDHGIGKDRPVLVIGRDESWLLGLMLSSQDHDGDPAWHEIGSEAWNRDGRSSSVRLDRILRLDPRHVRREGAALDRRRFDAVAQEIRTHHRWR